MKELLFDNVILERFGAPLLKRKEEITQKIQNPESKYPIEIMGKMKQIPVISVRIEFPVYRLANGRTKSLQLVYLSTHKDKARDLFTNDHDSFEAQSTQHELLYKLAKEEDLLTTFKDEELEQVDPILCTDTGVVLNGNRRLCAWRSLYYDDPHKYKHFETISIAVLPPLDEKAISEIEKRLQIQKTMRAEYHWHTKALMVEEDLKKGDKDIEVAKSYGMKKKDMLTLVEARKFADQYLRHIGFPDEWSRVDKSYYAFESVVTGSKKILDTNERELFKKLAFDLIGKEKNLEDTPSGRLYTTIKDYADHIHAIAAELAKKNNPAGGPASDNAQEKTGEDSTEKTHKANDGQVKVDKPSEKPDDNLSSSGDDVGLLLGDEDIPQDDASSVSTAIDNGAEISHTVIKEVIDVQKALEDEKTKSFLLLDYLSKASSTLQSAIDNALIEEANVEGAEEQVKQLETRLANIKNWIENKKKL